MHTFSDHALPITALHVGAGELGARVATASADGCVKLYEIADGTLVCSVAFPVDSTSPAGCSAGADGFVVRAQAAVGCCAMDPAESAIYAGCADGGLFRVALKGAVGPRRVAPCPERRSSLLGGRLASARRGRCTSASGAPSLRGTRARCRPWCLPPPLRASAPRGEVSDGLRSQAVTLDAGTVVSGGSDGTVRVWDAATCGLVKILSTAGAVRSIRLAPASWLTPVRRPPCHAPRPVDPPARRPPHSLPRQWPSSSAASSHRRRTSSPPCRFDCIPVGSRRPMPPPQPTPRRSLPPPSRATARSTLSAPMWPPKWPLPSPQRRNAGAPRRPSCTTFVPHRHHTVRRAHP